MQKGIGIVYSADEMRRTIEWHGVRLTPQRSAIVEALSMFSGVFSVADLQKSLERSNPDLGRATLFRAIDLFVKLGFSKRYTGKVRKTDTSSGSRGTTII